MKTVFTTSAALLLATTTIATAGGIGRSGQSIDMIFEPGTYAEISFGYVSPSVSGERVLGPFSDTGDMASSYVQIGGGFKMDFGDKFSAGIVFDQPFGADVLYPSDHAFYNGIAADLNSQALTALISYDVTENIVVFGGLKAQAMDATAAIPGAAYTITAESDVGFGYVVGAAYQIPEIALRVALTYHSEVSTSHDVTESSAFSGGADVNSTLDISTPQSINLEVQSAVNEKTLVFGSIRWVNWSAFDISPAHYVATPLSSGGNPLVSYDNDVFTYSIGVGRKFTDEISGALTMDYEASQGGTSSTLAPTDGKIGLGAGISYKMNDYKFTFGGKYVWLGDADEAAGGRFEDNTAIAFGVGISKTF